MHLCLRGTDRGRREDLVEYPGGNHRPYRVERKNFGWRGLKGIRAESVTGLDGFAEHTRSCYRGGAGRPA